MGALKGGGEVGIPCLEPLCPFSLLDGGCDDYVDGRVCKVRFDANGATGPGGRDPTQVKLLPGRHMLFPPLERVHYLQVRDPAVHVPFWASPHYFSPVCYPSHPSLIP